MKDAQCFTISSSPILLSKISRTKPLNPMRVQSLAPVHIINWEGRYDDWAGNPLLRGQLSTVDLLVLTCSCQLLLLLKIYLLFFTKQAILTRGPTVLFLPLQWEFPGLGSESKTLKIFLSFYKTSYIIKEANRIVPSPSVRIPWTGVWIQM